jgi:hypothetical protein
VLEALHEKYGAVPRYQHDLAVTLRELGLDQWFAGEKSTGRKNVERARDMLRALVEQYPKDTNYQHELQLTEQDLASVSSE